MQVTLPQFKKSEIQNTVMGARELAQHLRANTAWIPASMLGDPQMLVSPVSSSGLLRRLHTCSSRRLRHINKNKSYRQQQQIKPYTWSAQALHIKQWFSTCLILRPLYTVSHVTVTSNCKIILLILLWIVNIWYAGYLICRSCGSRYPWVENQWREQSTWVRYTFRI